MGITASGRALDNSIFLETTIGGGAWISAALPMIRGGTKLIRGRGEPRERGMGERRERRMGTFVQGATQATAASKLWHSKGRK